MTYATATDIGTSMIPVVDIGPLRDRSAPESVAKALHRASTEVGFIYVTNHGIEPAILDDARKAALEFFRDDVESKSAALITAKHRGWLAQGAAKMKDDAKPDLKESYVWGYQDRLGDTPDDHPLRGRNIWPEAMPQLEIAAMRWFEAAHDVARDLLHGFALGLGLPPDFFLGKGGAPMSRASFVYYPPQPESLGPEQFGVGPHTDFGVLTVLAQDDVGGLQVQGTTREEWITAPPIEGTLIVNVGDLLARWTNDKYRSTPHRVVNASGRERVSLVLAYDPEPQTIIDPTSVFGPDVTTAYDPITCGDYLTWRFEKAFSYRKS